MIVAENINYTIGDKRILENVSVAIKPGQITTVLGQNGSGKSTLLKCLTGTITPNSGAVILDDKPLADYPLKELSRKRAVLSQANPINFPFTVMEIVLMGRSPYVVGSETAEDKEIAAEALRNVDAYQLKDRVFLTLSGGEQQRVQLARVLAQILKQKNAYLFLDEPTSALDLKHQHRLLKLIHTLSEEKNMAATIVMHDLNLAKHYSDHVILLKDGRVFDSGTPEQVLSESNIVNVFEVPAELVFGDVLPS